MLGDALGGGTAASLGGTAVTSATSAKRTASPGSIPVLNQSTSEAGILRIVPPKNGTVMASMAITFGQIHIYIYRCIYIKIDIYIYI